METQSKESRKKSHVQILVLIFLLIIMLPLVYLFVSQVLLPLEWKESDPVG